ncbi:MAG: hypothetical protein IJ272_06320 [Clostridia bacterium]|nr:hypothetical protein [Clostridia bacterium]
MKVFAFKKVNLIIFICLVICICGIMTVYIGGVIQTNATPATNKTVILDARPWSAGLRHTECEWYNRTRVEPSNNFKTTTDT